MIQRVIFVLMVVLWGNVAFSDPATLITRFSPPLEAAFGIELADTGVQSFTPAEAKVILHPFVSVSFDVKNASPNGLIGALLRSADGTIQGTELRPRWATSMTQDLPQCPENLPSPSVLAGQVGMLQSLVDVRSGRARVSRELFLVRLANFSEERLAKLEAGFGLVGSDPQSISEVEDPYTLIDRLVRILHAIRTYAAYRGRR